MYYMRLYCCALLLYVMMMMLFIYIFFFVSFLYFVKVFCECVRTRVSARKNLLSSQVYHRLLFYYVFRNDTHKYDVSHSKWFFKAKRWKLSIFISFSKIKMIWNRSVGVHLMFSIWFVIRIKYHVQCLTLNM